MFCLVTSRKTLISEDINGNRRAAAATAAARKEVPSKFIRRKIYASIELSTLELVYSHVYFIQEIKFDFLYNSLLHAEYNLKFEIPFIKYKLCVIDRYSYVY